MSGQLGSRTATNSNAPQAVLGPWKSPSGKSLVPMPEKLSVLSELYVKNVRMCFSNLIDDF